MLNYLLFAAFLSQQGEATASQLFASARMSVAAVFDSGSILPPEQSIRFTTSTDKIGQNQLLSTLVSLDGVRKSLAWIGIGWYIFVWSVCWIGYLELRRRYSKPLPKTKTTQDNLPFVSILRPIKGVDPHLALTLSSTFHTDYPAHLYEIVFCIASPLDPAVPIVRSLVAQYPNINAKLLLGEEPEVGANPKIRTLSKAYKEVKGDIVWVIDSNIWLPSGILDRSVRDLCGLDENGIKTKQAYKLLHHLPIAIDTDEEDVPGFGRITKNSSSAKATSPLSNMMNTFGGALEEAFLSTSHCKLYTAINTLNIAPCALGKSTMWRRSHLAATTPSETSGIIHFAPYICEDHMLGAHIYENPLPEETGPQPKELWGKHIMGADLVYQPLTNMKVNDYIDRRKRWLRVRKFAVISATIMEPNMESVLATLWGSYGAITLLERYAYICFNTVPKYAYMALFWITGMACWSCLDYCNFKTLHSFASVPRHNRKNLPAFVTCSKLRKWETPLGWAKHWIAREFLAFPIWVSAMLSNEVSWRGGKYVVLWDLTGKEVMASRNVEEEIGNDAKLNRTNSRLSRSRCRSKRGKKKSGDSNSRHQRRLSLKL